MNPLKTLIVALLLLTSNSIISQVKLPKLISDGIVLQKDVKIPIWGWASPNEKITITINRKKCKTNTNAKGEWSLKLPKMKAGGPYTIKISGKNYIEIKDVLIGDVWLCSGQSNMEHQLYRHDITYANEIATANYPEIRHYKVPKTTSISGEKEDLTGGQWAYRVN